MKVLVEILLMIGCLGSVCAQQIPFWVRRLPDLPNMPAVYQGLGSTPTSTDVDADWQKASGQARAQILQQIRVVVVNRVSATIEETSSAKESSVEEAFSSTTEQFTAGTLESVAIERWVDPEKNILYAYASISKAEVELRVEERLQSAASAARVFYEAAAKAKAEGETYLALENYLQAIKVVTLAETYLHKTLHGDLRGKEDNVPMLPILQSEMCAALNSLQLLVTGGDEQLGEKGRSLSYPLSGKIIVNSRVGPVPAKNVALTALFVTPAAGGLATISRTNERGEFQLSATEIAAGDAVNKIRVGIALPGLEVLSTKLPDALRCLSQVYVDFTFRLKTRANVTIAIRILEYNLDKKRAKSSVQEEIQKQLIDDRYTIREESTVQKLVRDDKVDAAIRSGNFQPVIAGLSKISDIVVVGLVTTEQRTNPTAGFFFSSGTAVIRAIDTRSGHVIAAVSLDNEKEGGGSYEVAGMRLLQKIGKKLGEELKVRIDRTLK